MPIARRMGAAKLALEHGVTIQPSYLFGNSQAYSVWYDRAGRLQRLSRRLRVSVMPFWGRGFTPVPRRVPITFALGDELRVERVEAPDAARVAATHAEVLRRLEECFALYKTPYGWGERQLAFV